MDLKTQKYLEEAKTHFYSWRLVESYNILRRFFDRLPFKPELEHAEYIGMFARVMMELGKEHELKFYLGELERLNETLESPAISYSLAVVYTYLTPPKMEKAKTILEAIVRAPEAREFQTKAKMMLADYYARLDDFASCRAIIESMEEPSDLTLRLLLDIWRANILRSEKKFDEALARLRTVLAEVSVESNWYAYFSARVIEALTYMDKNAIEQASQIVIELRSIFGRRHFKTLQVQLAEIDQMLKNHLEINVLKFQPGKPARSHHAILKESEGYRLVPPADRQKGPAHDNQP